MRSHRRRWAIREAALVALGALLLPVALLAGPGRAAGVPKPVGFAGSVSHVAGARPGASAKLTSRNWDGYITYLSSGATDFTVVKASWVQPAVKCEAKQAWTAFWVGLDGWFDDTVEQGGSEAYCPTAGGAAEYYLWWEMYPTNSIQTMMAISAGDHVTASVTYATSTKVFTIVVKDTTTGGSFTKHETCASGLTCERSSTDIISEDIGKYGSGGYYPLADYGTMSYTGAGATSTAGHSGTLSDKSWKSGAVSEKAGAVSYATVSALTSGGASFATTWRHQ